MILRILLFFLPLGAWAGPLWFNAAENGVRIKGPFLDYEVQSSNRLRIGDQILDPRTLAFRLESAERLRLPEDGKDGRELVLVGRWPRVLIPEGEIEILNRAGRVLWRTDFKAADLGAWAEERRAARTGQSWLFGIRRFQQAGSEVLGSTGAMRVCLGRRLPDGYTRLCSEEMEIQEQNELQLRPMTFLSQPARVVLRGELAAKSGVIPLPRTEVLSFAAQMENGMSFEFAARPQDFSIDDILQAPSGRIRLTSHGARPSVPVQVLPRDSGPGSWANRLGMQETIGDFREFWQLVLAADQKSLFIPGHIGGLFRYDLEHGPLPGLQDRIYLEDDSPKGTYVDGAVLKGYSLTPMLWVRSKQLSVEIPADRRFHWAFEAKKRGEYNLSEIEVHREGRHFTASYEMYKGYPREITLRGSALVTNGAKSMVNSEAAFSYWFEDLFGWRNGLFSRQRWGISARTYQSLNEVAVARLNGRFQATNVDLKYRFRPGLWNRDETWGLILGVNETAYSKFHATQWGGGFFWARSMPKFFDDILNGISSYLRYPKWVDMDLTYYPSFSGGSAQPNNVGQGLGNWTLNFHGKIMWTDRWFGEAGFGIRQSDWSQEIPLRSRLQLTSFYGLLGVGLNF